MDVDSIMKSKKRMPSCSPDGKLGNTDSDDDYSDDEDDDGKEAAQGKSKEDWRLVELRNGKKCRKENKKFTKRELKKARRFEKAKLNKTESQIQAKAQAQVQAQAHALAFELSRARNDASNSSTDLFFIIYQCKHERTK